MVDGEAAPTRFSQGFALHQQGKLADAERIYREVLQYQPNHFDALHLLGVIALQTRRTEQAVALISNAIGLNANIAHAHSNLGNALTELKRPGEALASCDRAIALMPEFAEAHCNRGNALRDLKRPAEALASYDRAIALTPGFAVAHSNRGNALTDLKCPAEALASCDRAIAFMPGYAEAHNNRGNALRDLKRPAEALASYDRAIALKPDFAQAYNNRGVALTDLKRPAEALASYDRAVGLEPGFAEAHHNHGNALTDLKRPADALASYDRAVGLKPDFAEAHCSRGLALLLMGDFDGGLLQYEWRNKLDDAVALRFPQPLWLGEEDIADKILFIHCEQWLGDTIQFCRYAKLAEARGAKVFMSVQQPLRGLLKNLNPTIRIIGSNETPTDFDYHCPLPSLPLAFATRLETIPAERQYIKAEEELRVAWSARLPQKTRPRIGVVWSGSEAHKNDHNRSMELRQFLPAFDPDADWVCLQKEIRETDRVALRQVDRIAFPGDDLRDFSDTAALLDLMDLVITIDTSVAHLAGAMGKPVWILLPHNCDWRWLMERDDSPWYPSARLFRQRQLGNRAEVIDRMKIELRSAIEDMTRLAGRK
jgi:tetratricopeptide (TPR) repeat protein